MKKNWYLVWHYILIDHNRNSRDVPILACFPRHFYNNLFFCNLSLLYNFPSLTYVQCCNSNAEMKNVQYIVASHLTWGSVVTVAWGRGRGKRRDPEPWGDRTPPFNPCELFAASYSARSRELLRPHWWAATIFWYGICISLSINTSTWTMNDACIDLSE